MKNDIPATDVLIGETKISVDLDDAELPKEIANNVFQSGGYPYEKRLKLSLIHI